METKLNQLNEKRINETLGGVYTLRRSFLVKVKSSNNSTRIIRPKPPQQRDNKVFNYVPS